jgi:hypothetical protein
MVAHDITRKPVENPEKCGMRAKNDTCEVDNSKEKKPTKKVVLPQDYL